MANKVTHYPSNGESERSVIGGLLTDPANVLHGMATLCEDDFFIESHKVVFRAIRDIAGKGLPVDVVTVGDLLRLRGVEDGLGRFLDGFLGNFEAHVGLIRGLSKRRRIQAIIANLQENISDDDIDGLVGAAADELIAATVDRRNEPVTLSQAGIESRKKIEEAMGAGAEGAGIKTGFDGFDQHTGGVFKGDQFIIAARPGVGKTIMALNICVNAARRDVHSIFINVEMPVDQLATRVISSLSGVENFRLRQGKITDREVEQVVKSSAQLLDLSVLLLYERNWNKIKAQIRAAKYRDSKLQIFVLDFVNRLQVDNRSRDRREEIALISSEAKSLARDLDMVSITLAQVKREQDKDKEPPRMSDLRECGNLEEDADFVTFLHQNAKYNSRVDWIIRKARNAPTGTIMLKHVKERVTFYDWDGSDV